MPRLSCWFVRSALAHLLAGVLLGGLILCAKGFPHALSWAWLLLPAHIQVVIGGWMIQLALGVAYWILPRLTGANERGRPATAWGSLLALNVGVDGAALVLSARAFWPGLGVDWLLIPAALLQVAALVLFAWHAWPRIQATPVPAELRRRIAEQGGTPG